MSDQPRFDFDSAPSEPLQETADARARRLAVDPLRNVALEASAGTGKTRVLVDRYVRLLEAGVAPRNILAITFTRKAAAEMRQRVMATVDVEERACTLDDLGEAREAFLASTTREVQPIVAVDEIRLEEGEHTREARRALGERIEEELGR